MRPIKQEADKIPTEAQKQMLKLPLPVSRQSNYQQSGLVGLDKVSINPAYGGNPNTPLTSQLWTFALPRQVEWSSVGRKLS